ncbi:hypothetical protein GCM10027414_34870 [Humibacter ginsengiterrae]
MTGQRVIGGASTGGLRSPPNGGRTAQSLLNLRQQRTAIATTSGDLDHAASLVARNLHPAQVVIRNLAFTQPLAQSLYRETNPDGSRRWAGIRW